MANSSLGTECLAQLRDYLRSCGGELQGTWTCRAQIRDYGSRAGSVDTWFTAPDGEVYRSKVAVARGLGLDPRTLLAKARAQKPKAPRKPSKPSAPRPAAVPAPTADDGWRWGGSSTSAVVDLTQDDIAELLLSMPAALDGDDVYEGPLFYRDAQAEAAAQKAARLAAAAQARAAEAAAAAEEAAELAALEECSREASPEQDGTSPSPENKPVAQDAAAADSPDAEMADAAEPAAATEPNSGSASPAPTRTPARVQGDDAAPTASCVEPVERGEPASDAQQDGTPDGPPAAGAAEQEGGKASSRRGTRRQMAVAVAAAARELEAERVKQAEEAAAKAAEEGMAAAMAAAQAELDAEEEPLLLQTSLPEHFFSRKIEMEIIRKCFVRAPMRLGRPPAEEPRPLSPTSRDRHITEALLHLAAQRAERVGQEQHLAWAAAGDDEDDPQMDGSGDEAAQVADWEETGDDLVHWSSRRFPIAELTANDGAPLALHPSALFYLRYREEQAALEAATAEAAALAKQQAKLEKEAGGGSKPASDRPRLPLPKPANLSLRGKTVEEVEEALMERLSAYVSELGGVLPPGWRVKASVRQNGANAGGVDAYYYDPSGRRHKSMIKVAEAVGVEASAAYPKPKPLGSTLRASGARGSPGALAEDEAAHMTPAPADVMTVEEVQEALAAVGATTPVTHRSSGGDGSPTDGGSGLRKTCGVCRTCLNPQLKKGCLANKAKGSSQQKREKPRPKAPAPPPVAEPPPPRKMTARQVAKAQREAEKRAEAQRLREEAAAAEEEEEEVEMCEQQEQVHFQPLQLQLDQQRQQPEEDAEPAFQLPPASAHEPDFGVDFGMGTHFSPDGFDFQAEVAALGGADAHPESFTAAHQEVFVIDPVGSGLHTGMTSGPAAPLPKPPLQLLADVVEPAHKPAVPAHPHYQQQQSVQVAAQAPGFAHQQPAPQQAPATSASVAAAAWADAALVAPGDPESDGGSDEDSDVDIDGDEGCFRGGGAVDGQDPPSPGAPGAAGTSGKRTQSGRSGGSASGDSSRRGRSSSDGGGTTSRGGAQKRVRSRTGAGGDDDDDDDGKGNKRIRGGHEEDAPAQGGQGGQGSRKAQKAKPQATPKKGKQPSSPAKSKGGASAKKAKGGAPQDEEARAKKEASKQARREKRKLRDNEVVRNVYDRAYNRLRGQLSRLRQEQALVEAYAADGWRGASREKVKPVAEIKRAKEQITRCKELIRECVRVCDEAEGDTPIPEEHYDEEGELDLDHIFCSKCLHNDSTDDNDIILCDGHCNRAYHVKCLVPPVDASALPEEEGWLCPSCDRKIDMIDIINDEFGTDYDYEDTWERVLAPGTIPTSPGGDAAAAGPGSPRGAPVDLDRLDGLLAGADLPSEDEEDEDYEASGSDSDAGSAGEEQQPSGDAEQGAADSGGSAGGASGGESGSQSSGDVSDLASEDLAAAIEDVDVDMAELQPGRKRQCASARRDGEGGTSGGRHEPTSDSEEAIILQGKRRRTAVDYRALNQEMFGDLGSPLLAVGVGDEGEEEEEDEVWSPKAQAAAKRKARRAEREASDDEEQEEEAEEGEDDPHENSAVVSESPQRAQVAAAEGEEAEEGANGAAVDENDNNAAST